MASAKVVVVNHTLFFALLETGDELESERPSGFLFPNDFVVLDEAHTLEQVAAVQLGLRVSQAGLRTIDKKGIEVVLAELRAQGAKV